MVLPRRTVDFRAALGLLLLAVAVEGAMLGRAMSACAALDGLIVWRELVCYSAERGIMVSLFRLLNPLGHWATICLAAAAAVIAFCCVGAVGRVVLGLLVAQAVVAGSFAAVVLPMPRPDGPIFFSLYLILLLAVLVFLGSPVAAWRLRSGKWLFAMPAAAIVLALALIVGFRFMRWGS